MYKKSKDVGVTGTERREHSKAVLRGKDCPNKIGVEAIRTLDLGVDDMGNHQRVLSMIVTCFAIYLKIF